MGRLTNHRRLWQSIFNSRETTRTCVAGYANATEIAREALETGARVYDLVLAKGLLSKSNVDRILDPLVLTVPENQPRSYLVTPEIPVSCESTECAVTTIANVVQ
jgi:aspartate ammonia-lyase